MYESTSEEGEEIGSEGEDVDMEDLGSIVAENNRKNEEKSAGLDGIANGDAALDGITNGDAGNGRVRKRIVGKKPKKELAAPREMITPALRAALTKQVWRHCTVG